MPNNKKPKLSLSLNFTRRPPQFCWSNPPTPPESKLIGYRKALLDLKSLHDSHMPTSLPLKDYTTFLGNFCVHGTNVWTLLSAFLFTQGQLIPGDTLRALKIPIMTGETKGGVFRSSDKIEWLTLTQQEQEQMRAFFGLDNSINRKYVSTINLDQGVLDPNFEDSVNYASKAASSQWIDPWEVWVNTVQATLGSMDEEMLENLKELYEYTSKVPVVLLGEGISLQEDLYYAHSDISQEVVFPQVNIRGVISKEESTNDFLKSLLTALSSEQVIQLLFLTSKQITELNERRPTTAGRYDNLFKKDFYPSSLLPLDFISFIEAHLKTNVEAAFLSKLPEKLHSIKPLLEEYLQSELFKTHDPKAHEVHIRNILKQIFSSFDCEDSDEIFSNLSHQIVSDLYQTIDYSDLPTSLEDIKNKGEYLGKNNYESIYRIEDNIYKIPTEMSQQQSMPRCQLEEAATLWNEVFTHLYEGQFSYLAVAKVLELTDSTIVLKLPYLKGQNTEPHLDQLQEGLIAINQEALFCYNLRTEVISGYTLPTGSNFFRHPSSLDPDGGSNPFPAASTSRSMRN